MKKLLLVLLIFIIAEKNYGQEKTQDLSLIDVDVDTLLKKPQLEFVGNANIQKSISSGDDLPANTGIGLIYREDLPKRFKALHSIEIELYVNIASTVDSIKTNYDENSTNVKNKSDFGNSILLPTNSGQAFGFRFTGYFTRSHDPQDKTKSDLLDPNWLRIESPLPPFFGLISGFNVFFSSSNRNWYDSSSDTAIKVSNVSAYVGIFHEFIKREPDMRKDYSITFGVGITGRLIAGDLASDENRDLRTVFLGNDKTSFLGFEAGLAIRVRNIRAEVKLPFLPQNDNIPGLSGLQPNTFIGFVGGFSLDLN